MPGTSSDPGYRLVRRGMRFLWPFRGAALAILGLALLGAALNAAEPLVLKRIFDALGGPGAARALVSGLGLLGILSLSREAALALSNWLSWHTRLKVHFAITEATVDRLHGLPISFHRQEPVGAVMQRLERGIQGFVGSLTELTFNTLPSLAYLVLSAAVLLRLDWRVGLVVLAFAPIPGIIAALAAPAQTRRERGLLERWVGIYSRLNEVLAGIVTVKSFAMEESEKKRFLSQVRSTNEVVSRGVAFDAGVGAAQSLATAAARVAAIAVGGWLVVTGRATLGTVVAVLGYLSGLFGPVQGLSGLYKTLQTARVSLEQVFAILDAEDHVEDGADAAEPGPLRGEVRFEDVHFAFPGGHELLRGIDLHVRPGEAVALVGPSGAGKTTLITLLQRFYDPSAGRILVDGRDLKGLKQRSVRGQIGVVLQDSLLFNESVRDNIAYGRPQATDAEIEAAARAAHAHEFVERLPNGYRTVVGERGSRLSAGERQRIAIARALLKDPAILVLDEPTSALDAESEALVQEALDRVMAGRTTFAIAHRLSTVVNADRILVLRKGRIVEQGSHAELMSHGGYYASLVSRQTRGLVRALPRPAPAQGSRRAAGE
ncbi:ABC transporter ATP-binding protein [Anaeromyxobacter paludicola]|uniref:ABC transporter ATP-binding protein n=1 Tax=Anaeromyxobacter paludicola TaxID=2918171 RepID=A0ABM7X6M4_9BACT|nr:ABC transporter ATP-binding protein [Anaeromyxobacter paludicola]BDG07477.1 ABC transporter ATP-binding protein [Anaeromyxobacter paludicola]